MHGDAPARRGAQSGRRVRAAVGNPRNRVAPSPSLRVGSTDQCAALCSHASGWKARSIAREIVGFREAAVVTSLSMQIGDPCTRDRPISASLPPKRGSLMVPRVVGKTLSFRGACSRGAARIGDRPSFPNGQRDLRLLPCHASGAVGSTSARTPVGSVGLSGHVMAALRNPPRFRRGSTHQCLPHRSARGGVAPGFARELVGFSCIRSHGVARIGNQQHFHRGCRDQRLHPRQARGGVAPRIDRKPVRLSSPRSHGMYVTANPASFHRGSTHQRLPPCSARGEVVP